MVQKTAFRCEPLLANETPSLQKSSPTWALPGSLGWEEDERIWGMKKGEIKKKGNWPVFIVVFFFGKGEGVKWGGREMGSFLAVFCSHHE